MDFNTKDSGERKEFTTGMQRDVETGKPSFDLMLPLEVPYDQQMLTRFAQLLSRGAEKYDERNWEKAETMEELSRFKRSAARHFFQWMTGELDEDHASAVYFNIMGAEMVKFKMKEGK